MCYNIRQQIIDKIFETENLCYLISDSHLDQIIDAYILNKVENFEEWFNDWKNFFMKDAKFVFTIQQLMDYCIKFGKCADKQDFCNWFLEIEQDNETVDEYLIWKKVVLDNEGQFYLVYPMFSGNKLKRVKFVWQAWYTSPAFYPEYAKQYLSENSVKTKG
jgi:hypothetical protein